MTDANLEAAFAELTEPQRTAMEWQDGALLVLAGPGSGKTKVLTSRIARLLDQSRDRAFRVLALTFTNKAADEMAARVALLVPGVENRTLIGTFHSFCMQVLQQHGVHIGIGPDFTIYSTDDDRREILRQAMRPTAEPEEAAGRYLPVIDKLKSRLISPEGCSRHFKDAASGAKIEVVFTAYEAEMQRLNALDFSSLISRTYALVTAFPGIAARYRRTYPYWLIDEFQDTTDGQYKLVKALAGNDFHNVFLVADDDQIIYQWNGASFKQIQRFRADFKPEVLQLSTNYRCPPAIVAAANLLVSHNVQRTAAKLPLEAGKTALRFPPDTHVTVRRFASDADEAEGTALAIIELGRKAWPETAILGRSRSVLEPVKAALQKHGIPAVIAQRRDDFQSPQFQWLGATLRQAARPLDRRNFERLVSAFNRMLNVEARADLIQADAELSSRSFLAEWAPNAQDLAGGTFGQTLASEAGDLALAPVRFRAFIKNALEAFGVSPDGQGQATDLSEDRAAWSDLVRAINQSLGRDATLERFLQELAMRSKEPPIGAETVTLMTIHGAKGKEFDHVHVVGLAEQVLPSYQSVKAGDETAEMEEERRNCFVAITRTRECLTLSWADQYRGWSRSRSRFLQEMGFGQEVAG